MRSERDELVGMLAKAYWMEIETVMSYMANSINPDGVRAQEIIESLRQDVDKCQIAGPRAGIVRDGQRDGFGSRSRVGVIDDASCPRGSVTEIP